MMRSKTRTMAIVAFRSAKSCLSRSESRRSGVTLVELLVVVSLLIILIGVLTAALQPVITGAEVREAARQLNAYVASAIARAAQTGRPAGIWLERYDTDGDPMTADNAVFEVFYAEVPPLYAGDFTNSTAQITASTTTAVFTGVSPLRGPDGTAGTKDDLVRSGDLVRFSYMGPWYSVATVPSDTSITYTVAPAQPAPLDQAAVPFQIRRLARKSPVDPLQMPANTIVDLANSGVGSTGTFVDTVTGSTPVSDPVLIMFSPDGSIDYVQVNGVAGRVAETVYLLVGRPERLGPANIAQADENRWIGINHQTGRTITVENAGGGSVSNARQWAREGRAMGGRS